MPSIYRSALLPYSAQEVYELVDNIKEYPKFVPYCQDAREISRQGHEVIAELLVAKSGIAKSFTTKNINEPGNSIKMQLVDGPFKSLNGEWRFVSLAEQASKIELELEFEFSNPLSAMAFSALFEKLTSSMVNAFCERAKTVYGVR